MTIQKKRTKKLRDERQDFYRLVDRSADAMIVLDCDGAIRYVNPAGTDLFNMRREEMIGKLLGFPIILHEPIDIYVLREFREFVAVELRMVEVEWEGKPSYLVTLRDVTWRVKYDEELSRARDELEVKVRERTIELSDTIKDLNLEAGVRRKTEEELRRARRETEFLFDLMGDDIGERDRAALDSIGKAVDELNVKGRLERDRDLHLLTEAARNIEGSTQIISNINILRSIDAERLKREQVDLNAMLPEVIGRFSRIPGRDISIHYHPSRPCEKTGCKVIAMGSLREAFANIITNALERSTGHLTLNILLDYVIEGDERYCRVAVEDNSPGISGELKHHVFELGRLDIAEKRVEGLGLFVAKKLVELAGGTIRVEDLVAGDHSKGSRFIITIPSRSIAPGLFA